MVKLVSRGGLLFNRTEPFAFVGFLPEIVKNTVTARESYSNTMTAKLGQGKNHQHEVKKYLIWLRPFFVFTV